MGKGFLALISHPDPFGPTSRAASIFMADPLAQSKRSALMRRIRSRGNKSTEGALAAALRRNRVAGWRRHLRIKILDARRQQCGLVRPDFVFPQQRVAVFVDGCFWHCCKKHAQLPASNREWWQAKMRANKARDRRNTRGLRSQGWCVLRLWEHDLDRDVTRCAEAVRQILGRAGTYGRQRS
jgi:DNA mismatch endonuclease (patch repair protein)